MIDIVIYISGPMRWCEEYPKRFAKAEKELKGQQCVVLNPAWLPLGLNESAYMPICLAMLDAADAIYMLRGWELSDGAKLEKAYAEYQGKYVYYEREGG